MTYLSSSIKVGAVEGGSSDLLSFRKIEGAAPRREMRCLKGLNSEHVRVSYKDYVQYYVGRSRCPVLYVLYDLGFERLFVKKSDD